jgi:hypothetical protein
MRSINRYGELINREGAIVKALLERGMRSPNAERFLREATAHCQTCAAAVHAAERPPRTVTMEIERYSRFANVRFGESALRSAVKHAHMTSQGAIVEIEAGRWDPYSDIEFPTPAPEESAREEFAPPARPPSWSEVREDPT